MGRAFLSVYAYCFPCVEFNCPFSLFLSASVCFAVRLIFGSCLSSFRFVSAFVALVDGRWLALPYRPRVASSLTCRRRALWERGEDVLKNYAVS